MDKIIFFLTILILVQISACAKPDGGDSKDDTTSSSNTQPAVLDSLLDQFNKEVVVEQGGNGDRIVTGIEVANTDDKDVGVEIKKCGVDNVNDKSTVTSSVGMTYSYLRIINAGVAVAEVPINAALQLEGTLGQTTLDVSVTIGSVAATSELGDVTDLSSVEARAEEIAAQFRGPATATQGELNSKYEGAWDTIFCTIIPAYSLVNKRGGYITKSTFNDAFPPAISPIADPIVYQEEITTGLYFGGLTATITETDNPLLTVGQQISGGVLVERIPPSIVSPAGTIEADAAFRITNLFGTPEQTLALGFHLWTEYYIDHDIKDYVALTADVGDVEIMHFREVEK